jgi:hypothetical protein
MGRLVLLQVPKLVFLLDQVLLPQCRMNMVKSAERGDGAQLSTLPFGPATIASELLNDIQQMFSGFAGIQRIRFLRIGSSHPDLCHR